MSAVQDEFLTKIASVVEAVASGSTFAEAFNIEHKHLETIYKVGFDKYNAGAYKDAVSVFKALVLYDHLDQRFSMGLASSLQMLGKYEEAIEVYGVASVVTGLDDPTPLYFAAQCMLKIGRVEDAMNTLESIKYLGTSDTYVDVRTEAKALLETLEG